MSHVNNLLNTHLTQEVFEMSVPIVGNRAVESTRVVSACEHHSMAS